MVGMGKGGRVSPALLSASKVFYATCPNNLTFSHIHIHMYVGDCHRRSMDGNINLLVSYHSKKTQHCWQVTLVVSLWPSLCRLWWRLLLELSQARKGAGTRQIHEPYMRQIQELVESLLCGLSQLPISPQHSSSGLEKSHLSGSKTLALLMVMGDLAADCPTWWHWAYLGLWQSSSQLQMISPTLARWRWAYLGSAMLKPAKSLIKPMTFKIHSLKCYPHTHTQTASVSSWLHSTFLNRCQKCTCDALVTKHLKIV